MQTMLEAVPISKWTERLNEKAEHSKAERMEYIRRIKYCKTQEEIERILKECDSNLQLLDDDWYGVCSFAHKWEEHIKEYNKR